MCNIFVQVREQASELSALLGRLEVSGAYARLCERRLLEVAPDHPLPVTSDHLGHFAGIGEAANACPIEGIGAREGSTVGTEASYRGGEEKRRGGSVAALGLSEQLTALRRRAETLDAQRADLAAKLKAARAERDAKVFHFNLTH